jgi:hypothetical protein
MHLMSQLSNCMDYMDLTARHLTYCHLMLFVGLKRLFNSHVSA